MFSPRSRVSGFACLHAAFPANALRGLPEAIAALDHAHQSQVVQVLVTSLNPHHWRSSRSAVDGLWAQGRASLCAAPAIAGWLKLCVDYGMEAEQKYGINEALHTLTRQREMLAEPDPLAPHEAFERVQQFFDEVFQPYLLSLLVPPVRYWQRGIVSYLRPLHGDLEGIAAALQGFGLALREETWRSGANSDWDEYTHSEVLSLTGELGPHLERIRVERGWRERPLAEPPLADAAVGEVEPQGLPEQTVAWAQQELAAPSVSRRRAACRVIRQFGSQAESAGPALLAMLSQLDDTAPGVVEELREEALAALRAITPPTPASGQATEAATEAVDRVSTEAAERLLVLAGEDTEANVRTAALYAITSVGAPSPEALAVALRAAAAEDPQERAAAARLLAMLAQ